MPHGTSRLARRLTAVLAAVVLALSLGARPAAAASGGGCRDSANSIVRVGVCISYRPSDRTVLPDFYVNWSFFSGNSFWWYMELQRADGRRYLMGAYPHKGVGHYGPYPVSTSNLGAGGTWRTMIKFESLGCCGDVVTWAGPFYSPWLNYP
jgi:hypothetical protein